MKTIEELGKLSDEELRVMCAEAAGKCTHPKECRQSETVEDADDSDTSYWCSRCGKDYIYHPVPNYPTDLSAAMQLCEILADEGWNCETNMGLNKCWEVIFLRSTKVRNERTREKLDGSLWEEYYAPADTLARAITIAFIAVKAGKDAAMSTKPEEVK
jgi:DNA-directed RNA polymerase subunit RPC12/RpoP